MLWKNWDDSTWTVGRFDLPYETVAAAVASSATHVIVYSGVYVESTEIIIHNANKKYLYNMIGWILLIIV